MLSLFRAEWRKVTRDFLLAGFTVWIFPIGAGAFLGILIVLSLISERVAQGMAVTSSGQWTTDAMAVWPLVTSFTAIGVRLAPMAFMAVMFAGEYQWRTWTNIIPRTRRVNLILVKFFTLAVMVMLSLVLTSVILGVGEAIAHKLLDLDYGPALTATVLADFARDYLQQALVSMLYLLILAGLAALAALLTRSVVGGLLAGFGFSIMDALSVGVLLLFGNWFEKPDLVNLYQFTASYNVENALAWFGAGHAAAPLFPGFTAAPSLVASLSVLAAWAIGLMTLSAFIFQWQDITV